MQPRLFHRDVDVNLFNRISALLGSCIEVERYRMNLCVDNELHLYNSFESIRQYYKTKQTAMMNKINTILEEAIFAQDDEGNEVVVTKAKNMVPAIEEDKEIALTNKITIVDKELKRFRRHGTKKVKEAIIVYVERHLDIAQNIQHMVEECLNKVRSVNIPNKCFDEKHGSVSTSNQYQRQHLMPFSPTLEMARMNQDSQTWLINQNTFIVETME